MAKKEQTPAPHRRPDGTFAPGHPGKQPGTLSKHKRKLKELCEAEVDGDPLPQRMVRIGARAEADGDHGLALTAYVAAAQYIYGKVKPREAKDEQEDGQLPPGTSYKVIGPHEDPTPDYPGQRILIDPTRTPEDGVHMDRLHVRKDGRTIRFIDDIGPADPDPAHYAGGGKVISETIVVGDKGEVGSIKITAPREDGDDDDDNDDPDRQVVDLTKAL